MIAYNMLEMFTILPMSLGVSTQIRRLKSKTFTSRGLVST